MIFHFLISCCFYKKHQTSSFINFAYIKFVFQNQGLLLKRVMAMFVTVCHPK